MGAKELLRPARNHILLLAKAIDAERRKQYVLRYSRGLRAFLMTELPRIITACGGPKDEEEARQMFTMLVSINFYLNLTIDSWNCLLVPILMSVNANPLTWRSTCGAIHPWPKHSMMRYERKS